MGIEGLKSEIIDKASDNPEKFFPVEVLKRKQFSRGECISCGRRFWSLNNRDICGEPDCGNGYTFINDSPSETELGYVEAWKEFKDHMQDRGYAPIDRYPVVARWRDDTDFVQGSIYNFQPHVVSGQTEPPADELIVPQPSLRFNDVENVGVTGRHYVLHNHIGQTCFKRSDYDQNRYFTDMFEFVTQKLQIPKSEIIIHEDSWGGGGNLGASMEFFVGGLELLNQVYMFYDVDGEEYSELDLKVLDMGMGQERISWITKGTQTSYQSVFPEAVEYLEEQTGVETSNPLWEKFLPYSSRLNTDEVDDIDEVWKDIADEIGVSTEELKQNVKPITDLYAVAEHSRALLFPLADGKIPGSSGGGHNLRVVYRRMKDIIRKNSWDISINRLMEIHSDSLEPMFPDLSEKLSQIRPVLEAENQKYRESMESSKKKLETVEDPSDEEIRILYESHGITPEQMAEAGIEVPDDFYSMITSQTTDSNEASETSSAFSGLEDTKKLYYIDQELEQFTSTVEAVDGCKVALDRTCFYPQGGGQENDKGFIEYDGTRYQVEDVQIHNGTVVHTLAQQPRFSEGSEIMGEVDWNRRTQLMQHHTSTHMVHAAAREVLGQHVYQAGAKKSEESARLDITHFDSITQEQKSQIEHKVRQIQMQDHDVKITKLDRSDAEQKHGFDIYQGGAPPGNKVRLVEIEDVEVEACGGTHLSSTSDIDSFVITNTKRVQDGVDRIRFRAGDAAEEYINSIKSEADALAQLTDTSLELSHRELVREAKNLYKVETSELQRTVNSFLEDIDQNNHRIRKLSGFFGEQPEAHVPEGETTEQMLRSIYSTRKDSEKHIESLESELESELRSRMEDRYVDEFVPTNNIGLIIRLAKTLSKEYPAAVVIETESGIIAASHRNDFSAKEMIESKGYDDVQGSGEFAKKFF